MITIQNAPPAGPGFFSRLKSRISVLKSPAASASPPREHVAAFGLSSGNAHFRSGLERHDACSESAGFSAYSEQTPLSCHPEERSDEGSAFPAASAPDSPRLDHSVVIPSAARNPSSASAACNRDERSREAASPTRAAQKPISCHPEERSDEGSAFSAEERSDPAPAFLYQTEPAPAGTPDRCAFTFADGRQCRNEPAHLCADHAAKRRTRRAAADNADPADFAHLPELESLGADLTTAANVNAALARVFLLLAQGRIRRENAVAFGYLAQLLLQTLPGIRSEHVAAFGLSSWNAKLRSALERHDADACSANAGSPAYSEQTPLSCHPEERSDEGSAFPVTSAPDSPRLDRSVVIPSAARNPSYAFAFRCHPEERS